MLSEELIQKVMSGTLCLLSCHSKCDSAVAFPSTIIGSLVFMKFCVLFKQSYLALSNRNSLSGL